MMNTTFDKNLPVAIGSDHAGFEYKELLKAALEADGWKLLDKGTYSLDSVDYPDFAHPVANDVAEGVAAFGVLICGSGEGVCITANKHAAIRAALCWNNDVAQLSRQHNNANVICMPARFVSIDLAKEMLHSFMNTAFEGGRHEARVNKITCD
jgi:ribose 5-phosphate isomerase B